LKGEESVLEPLVTVIMPSLNVVKYIRACMESVVGQSMRELEILCIDAGSTDGTLEILKGYALSDKRVKVYQSDEKSYGKQVNMGIDMAKGKYIAVVETDDYIDLHMYEKLYAAAKGNQLDFVKADFMGFRELKNGHVIYDEGRVWTNEEVYNKVLSPEEYPELYIRDVNIWKGIYNRNFLKKHDIRLNETSGAAFQDIGFCHLSLRYAKRGMYLKDMLYFYRRDNEESSMNQPKGLVFAYQEYRRLLQLSDICKNDKLFYRYVYIRMCYVFVGEFEKILRYKGEIRTEYNEAIQWFKNVLSEKKQQKEIAEAYLQEETWKKLNKLISDEEGYITEWHDKKCERDKNREKLLDEIGEDKIIVFGCGHYGRECILFCDKYNVDIAAFCDNNFSLWKDGYFGYEVCKPSELKKKYSEMKILISTPKYEGAIRKQLLEIGFREAQILLFPVNV